MLPKTPLTNPLLILRIIVVSSPNIFSNYPYPSFFLFKLLKRFKNIMTTKFRLVAMPKDFFNLLTKSENLQSMHYVIVHDDIFEKYIKVKGLNWMNLIFSNKNVISKYVQNETEIVSSILKKPNISVLVPVLSNSKCDKNTIFVSENCFYNLVNKYKLSENNKIFVQLQPIQDSQHIPELATNCTIFLINSPYEIPNDVADAILNSYFEIPRILYSNYTYEMRLDESLVSTHFYAKHYQVFSNLKKLYFRCVYIESSENQFEISGIVLKGITSLRQSTSINYTLPKQILNDICSIDACPTGLIQYYNDLKCCILPYIPLNGDKTTLSSLNIFPTFLLQGERGAGKNTIATAVAQSLGIQIYHVDCTDIVAQIPAQTEAKLRLILNKVDVCEPILICLHNFEILGVDNEGREDLRIVSTLQNELKNLFSKNNILPTFLVALINEKEVKPQMRRLFLEAINISPPSTFERIDILKWLHKKNIISEEVYNKKIETLPFYNAYDKIEMDIEDIWKIVADKSQGFLYGDLKLLYENSIKEMKFNGDKSLKLQHFENCVSDMLTSFSDSLGAPKVPKVLWSDIGGLAKLKDEIQSSIGLPLNHLHLIGTNMQRSGILLYGPPGTGKTLVAKAVATECNLSFLSVQGPELLNMYVGQSEQNVREVFTRARAAAPCVIFLDELDSLAPNRGIAGDSGGVMDRVVSQLLAEMDGMLINTKVKQQIFILAATNRPDLIDPALLRPGRFDKLMYVGPCTTTDDKAAVLAAQLNRFSLSKSVTINSIAHMLKEDLTGADLHSVCSNAWLYAVRRTVIGHTKGKPHTSTITSKKVVVKMEDFKAAAEHLVPSVSKSNLAYFNKLKSNFSP